MKLLNADGLTMSVLAVLVKRLGGDVLVTQGELDSVAYGRLLEGFGPGELGAEPLALKYVERGVPQ